MTETPRLVLAYRAILAEASRPATSKKGGPSATTTEADQQTAREIRASPHPVGAVPGAVAGCLRTIRSTETGDLAQTSASGALARPSRRAGLE